ncbi:MAG: sulfatase [Thalassotalea sp.]|nr:sulfatase [Thalassotalea sp.]
MFIRLLTFISVFICATAQAQERPNILFIGVDDLKPLIGAYGIKEVITPNLDKLANESTVFQHAYTQWPVCGPSRASLLTGLRPESSGIMNLKDKLRIVNPNVVTMPELFRKNGYFTAASGKIFDSRNTDSKAAQDAPSWSVAYELPKKKVGKHIKDTDKRLAVLSIDALDKDFSDGSILQRGIDLLEQAAKQDSPFFVAVGFEKPHLPFTCPKKYFDLYDPANLPIAPFQDMPKGGKQEYISFNSGELVKSYRKSVGVKYDANNITESEQRGLLHGYYACTSFIDAQVGKLMAKLETTGQADNTIVVFWGDHGFHLGDHGMWGKHTAMEQALIVPLYFKVPGEKAQMVSSVAELTDIFPTLAELAGIETPELEGVSQVAVISGEKSAARDGAISVFKRMSSRVYSMRTERYRYSEWINVKTRNVEYTELYDLENDPLEKVNLATQATSSKNLAQLAKQLRANSKGLKLLN